MKKNMKKNNKGFSLVELIVVVLIMGIIAVALAPQVMKWVGTARENSDENTAKDIKSAVQVALAEWQQTNSVPTSGDNAKYLVNGGTALSITKDWGTNPNELSATITSVMGGDFPKPQKTGSSGFTIEIETTSGKVTVNY